MAPRDGPDPVRATIVAILQQLNRAESLNEGKTRDQTLELSDLERILADFWAVSKGSVKVPLALGLLVRNGMVEAQAAGNFPATSKGARPPRARYAITATGKQFLVDMQQQSDRIA
jgi:DNA-binding PadR family transcriptional regulator